MIELERLANLGTRAQKTARRDIAHVVSDFLEISNTGNLGYSSVVYSE